MNSIRRAATATLLAICSTLAAAADGGSGTITLIVPFTAGQGADTIMRLIAEPLSVRLGRSVIVENRAGAGGTLGTEYVRRQPPDGRTLLMGSSGTLSISPTLQPQIARYNPVKDFEPITGVASVAQVFVVPASSPYKTLQDLIAAAKAKPQTLTFGSSGNGTTQHLFVESFSHSVGIKLLHVPYKGAAPALTDLLGGRINMISDTIPAVLPQIKAGSLRALGVTSAERSPMLPNVPTLAEQGVKNFAAVGWISIVAPAGFPAAQADRLNKEIREVLAQPKLKQQLESMGFVEMPQSREALRDFIATELKKWKTVIDAAGIKVE